MYVEFTLFYIPLCYISNPCNSRGSSVSIATDYGMEDGNFAVRVPVGSRIFTSPHRPDRLWDPPSLLSNRYRELFPWGIKWQGHKLTTHLHLAPRSRKRGSIHLFLHTPSWRSARLFENGNNFSLCNLCYIKYAYFFIQATNGDMHRWERAHARTHKTFSKYKKILYATLNIEQMCLNKRNKHFVASQAE
jgi:hypothetical protein